jgi:peptidoglycan/xylan/chitin deacetylase (PgdA/CDA1 family)
MTARVAILEYHDLGERLSRLRDFHSPYVFSLGEFKEHMEWLSRKQYATLLIDDLFSNNIPEKSVVLTFDDGHISNYTLAFPVLTKFKIAATFFIVPMFIGKDNYLSKDQIHEMTKYGMRFESHSLTHPYMPSLNRQEIVREVRDSKLRLENILGDEIRHFSVPYGFYTKYLIQCVKENGYLSLVTENFGYYKHKDGSFQVLPRFAVKSHFNLKNLQNVLESRTIALLPNYAKEFGVRCFKAILGYGNYLRLKSLIIGKTSQSFGERSD